MKTVLLLISAALSFVPAYGADASHLIKSRKLVLQSFSANANGIEDAAWRGKVTIRGRLSLDLDRTPDAPGAADEVESSLSFIPDKAALGDLPVVLGNSYPGSPNLIGLANGKVADLGLGRFLPAAAVDEIKRQGFGHYEWRATLLMNGLKTSNGCDARGFYSNRYKISVDAKTVTHLDFAQNLGC